MTSFFRRLNVAWRRNALLALVASFVFVQQGVNSGLSASEWASWVQAIGSIAAILAAVWVSWQQSEQQRRRDQAKDRSTSVGILRCLCNEVETTILNRMETGILLENTPRHEPYRYLTPMSDQPFPIFDSLIPQLGCITDDRLQRKIIRTFSRAKNHVLTIRRLNCLIAAFEVACRENEKFPSVNTIASRKKVEKELIACTTEFRNEFSQLRPELSDLLENLLVASAGDDVSDHADA